MITKTKILEILNDWNFWEKIPETGFERLDYLRKMEAFFKTGLIVSLVGMRRSGKSTLMLQFAKQLIKENKVMKSDILYVNFEDARFLGEYSLDLLNAIYEAYSENLKPRNKPIIFLDEIQNIEGWEKFVNSLYERKTANIFVSGSSAHLLRSEFSAVLTGRQIVLTVHPLQFKEFLLFRNIYVKDRLEAIRQKVKIKEAYSAYMRYGGMPQAALMENDYEKEIILRNYVEDILSRDLINRFKIRQIDKLRILAKFYFTNIASPISYHRVKNFLKMPLATIERFSDYLTYPFLFYFVNKFAYSLKEQAVNPRKVYAGDAGLRNATSFNFSEDEGKLLENIVFLNLKMTEEEIYYYKAKNNLEVDFFIREKQKPKALIQAAVTLKKFETRQREIKSLTAAMGELNFDHGLIITADEEEIIEIGGKKIEVIPIYDWLLR